MNAECVPTVVVSTALIFSMSSAFAEAQKPESLMQEVESILGVSIATIACREESKLELVGMDFESCERQSLTLFRGCWEMMDSVEPEFALEPRFLSDDVSENADLRSSTLTECLKVSPLLFAEEGPWSPGSPVEDIVSSKDEAPDSAWPPMADNAVLNLSFYREDLDALRILMDETEYVTVAKSDGETIIVIWETDGQFSNKTLDDPTPWLELMAKSNIANVYRTNETLSFSIDNERSETNRADGLMYLHNDGLPAKICDDQFRGVACGICDVSRDELWTVRYMWMSGQYIEDHHRLEMEKFEKRMEAITEQKNGEAAESFDDNGDAMKEFNLKNRECLLRGLNEMGYDNPEKHF